MIFWNDRIVQGVGVSPDGCTIAYSAQADA